MTCLGLLAMLGSPEVRGQAGGAGAGQGSRSDIQSGDTYRFPAGRDSLEVPVEILANAPYVSARLNDKGPFLFVIDTGSVNSVFASELTEDLGLKVEGETRGVGAGSSYKMGVVRGKIEFALPGGLKIFTTDANTVSMAGLWPLIGKPYHGIIGYDVLKDLVIRFDYEKGAVTFYSPSTYKYTGSGKALPTKLQMAYDPQITGSFTAPGLEPIATQFTIDTGAGGTIVTAPLVRSHKLLEQVKRKIPSPSHGAGGGESQDVVGRIEAINLGPYKVQEPVVALSQDTEGSLAMEGLGVNLGGNILRRFHVIVDYPHSNLILEPNSHFAEVFRADASGLVLRAEGGDLRKFVVRAIVPGSPGANAGVKNDDVITDLDGKPAGQYALWQVQDLLKKSGQLLRLTIQRGAQTVHCDLALKSLI